jgi:hypothetical protein
MPPTSPDPASQIAQAGVEAVGSIISLLAARKLRQQSDTFRRDARTTEGDRISFAQQNFLEAQRQAKLFAPIIADTVDAFSNISLEDITSGRAASFQSEPVIETINQSAQEQTRLTDNSLARRGIGNDSVAQIERGNIERERGSLITKEKARSTRQEIDDRLGLLGAGLQQGDQLISAGQPVVSALGDKIKRLSGLAKERDIASKEAGSAAAKSGSGAALKFFNK